MGLKAPLRCALLITSSAVAGLPATASASETCGWAVVLSPSPGASVNALASVAAISANDAWAVGRTSSDQSSTQTLAEHWNGTGWTRVATPSPAAISVLQGVTAVSTGNVWAVGFSQASASGPSQTLIEHWDGNSWSQATSPSPGTTSNQLSSVAAASAGDVWAVGSSQSGSSAVGQTLIEHWTGSSWAVVASPSPGASQNNLRGVAAFAAGNAWAVGDTTNGGATPIVNTLIERWNGSAWTQATSPSPGTVNNVLSDIAGASANDIWTVGESSDQMSNSANKTVVEHWNGTSWTQVPSPNPGTSGSDLIAVAAVTSTDVWAVGAMATGNLNGLTLAAHWDGASWRVVPSPNPSPTHDILLGVAAVSGSDVWAVGEAGGNAEDPAQTLTEHFSCSPLLPNTQVTPNTSAGIPMASAVWLAAASVAVLAALGPGLLTRRRRRSRGGSAQA